MRHAWQYGGQGLVFPDLVEATVEVMGDWYTELRGRQDFITQVVTREEERFRRTLESGHQLLDAELQGEADTTLSGSTAFKLHDTYGFPIELTREIASERGVTVDSEGFEVEMAAQRRRAEKPGKEEMTSLRSEIYRSVLEVTGSPTSSVTRRRWPKVRCSPSWPTGRLDRAEEGREVEVFLSRTPFYGESGGQVGDIGVIETETGIGLVSDTQHSLQGLHGHRLTVDSGFIAVGQTATAVIDSPRREAIRKSHTGTHVLHWALREVLGHTRNRLDHWSSQDGSVSTSLTSARLPLRSCPKSRPG